MAVLYDEGFFLMNVEVLWPPDAVEAFFPDKQKNKDPHHLQGRMKRL